MYVRFYEEDTRIWECILKRHTQNLLFNSSFEIYKMFMFIRKSNYLLLSPSWSFEYKKKDSWNASRPALEENHMKWQNYTRVRIRSENEFARPQSVEILTSSLGLVSSEKKIYISRAEAKFSLLQIYKDGSEVQTVVAGDTDSRQFAQHYDKCPNIGGEYIKVYWDSGAIKCERFLLDIKLRNKDIGVYASWSLISRRLS